MVSATGGGMPIHGFPSTSTLIKIEYIAVSEHSRNVHAYLQPHLYDAIARTLERLSAVSRAHVTRFPARHMGRHQQPSS